SNFPRLPGGFVNWSKWTCAAFIAASSKGVIACASCSTELYAITIFPFSVLLTRTLNLNLPGAAIAAERPNPDEPLGGPELQIRFQPAPVTKCRPARLAPQFARRSSLRDGCKTRQPNS